MRFFLVALGAGSLYYIYKGFAAKAMREEAIKMELISRIKDKMESTDISDFLPLRALKEELLGANNFDGKHFL